MVRAALDGLELSMPRVAQRELEALRDKVAALVGEGNNGCLDRLKEWKDKP